MGHRACAPWSHVEAVQAFFHSARAGPADLEFSEVGASRATKLWWGHHVPSPMLKPTAAGLGALRPGGELGHDAVLPARDEARLLLPGLRLEVLTDGIFSCNPVGLLYAGDVPCLDPLLPSEALQGFLVAAGEDGPALVPAADLPVVQLLVPVADPETALLVVRPLRLLAVGGQRGPALHVGTPHCSRLDSSGAAFISHASPPWTWKTRENANIAYLSYFSAIAQKQAHSYFLYV